MHRGLRVRQAAAVLHCRPLFRVARRREPGMPSRPTDEVRRRHKELRLASGPEAGIGVHVRSDGEGLTSNKRMQLTALHV